MYVAESFDEDAVSGGGVFPYRGQEVSVAHRTIHKVDGNLPLPGVKSKNEAVAFASAVVFVVVGIEAERADVPQARRTSANARHQRDERARIVGGLLVWQCGKIRRDLRVM